MSSVPNVFHFLSIGFSENRIPLFGPMPYFFIRISGRKTASHFCWKCSSHDTFTA